MKMLLKITAGGVVFILLAIAGIIGHANIKIKDMETLAHDAEAPGRFVTVDGRRWHVATAGDISADVPILLIHGFGAAGHTMWMPWADRLSAQRALILPDLLGYGFSERNTTP